MLEGNFNVTRVRAVPRPLNIHILVPLKAMSIPFNVINEDNVYKIQVHNLHFSLRLLIQC